METSSSSCLLSRTPSSIAISQHFRQPFQQPVQLFAGILGIRLVAQAILVAALGDHVVVETLEQLVRRRLGEHEVAHVELAGIRI